jgi:FKBP-type peptidyl-prolyl cis-trans isomerase SlpA
VEGLSWVVKRRLGTRRAALAAAIDGNERGVCHDLNRAFYNGAQFIETPMENPLPQVQPGSFLTLHYRLAGPQGDVINTFDGPPATLSLGTGELSAAVEQHLLGMAEGAHCTFELPPGQAFGERKADMVQWVARALLVTLGDPLEQYQVGDVVQFPTPDGMGTYAGAVRQVGNAQNADAVLFDFNHPLSDQSVTFEVHVIGVL